jgi:hypothetical protein
VSGGIEGAKSSAQGSGGLGKSQTLVQLDSDSGATSTNAQSSGWNHGTNSQVQANAKGGLADAQANGEGQTSSQAQIGFQPYINRNDKLEKLEKPSHGGGTASAQSSTFQGQSQSQLQGSFHYGISYSGAAQAASGSGSIALRKPFNFTNPDLKLFKPFKLEENKKIEITTGIVPKEQLETSGSNSRQTIISITPNNKYLENKHRLEPQPFDSDNADNEYEEYDYNDYGDSQSMQPTTGFNKTKQKMRLFINNRNNRSEKNKMNEKVPLPEYTISADKKYMTSLLTKKMTENNITSQNKMPIISENGTSILKLSSNATLSQPNRIGGIYYGNLNNIGILEESVSPKTNFVSVSNNVAGKVKNQNLTKKYEHRYYTKSSSCGYFTFSCNVVYGSNGRRKICKPKIPTFTDGPSKC